MTSHHDVAARLREQAKDDHVRGCMGRQYSCDCGYDLRTEGLLEQAADLLEAQAKALSEAEAERDAARDRAAESGMLAFKWMERHDRIAAGKDGGEYPTPADVPNVLARALAAEARLAEAMRVIERDMEALTEADTQIEYLHDKFKPTGSGANAIARIDIALTAARAFTNAAKEKT